MKHITESFSPRFTTLARLGVAGVCLGTAALTGLAQSSSSNSANTSGSTSAQQGASERATDRASDRSALRRDSNDMNSGFSRQDRKFIEKFTEASQRELALAQLGAERATNPEVKAYAQKLVQEHQQMHRDFMTVASGGTLSASGSLAASTQESSGSMSASSSGSTMGSGASTTSGTSSANVPSRDDTGRNTSSTASTRGSSSSDIGQAGAGDERGSSSPSMGGVSRETSGTSTTAGTGTTGSSGALSASSGSMASASATDGKQDRHVRKLMEKEAGEDFDEAFVERMVEEHENGVEMLEDIVEDEDRNPQVRAFANKHLPIMREHLSRAKQLEDAVD